MHPQRAGPRVDSVAASPASGDEGIGKVITITLTFDKPVTVTGVAPSLILNDGGTATYSGGSGTNTLTFTYTVGATNQSEAQLAIASVTNPASVTDGAGNTASLTGVDATFAGLQIDTIVPAIASIAASPLSGTEQVGSTVTFTVTFSEAVTVTGGTPTLALNDGGVAVLTGGSGTNTLTFSYKVGASDKSLTGLAVTGLNLNGAAIADAAGNTATVTGTAKTFGGLVIDTVTPVVTQVSASPALGDIGLGKKVTITVTFDKAVTVKGAPRLTLSDGGLATYTGGSGTASLTFAYTVAAGQNTADLQATGITLPSGSWIKDSAGHAANLSGAAANLGVQIDTTSPIVSVVSASPSSGALNAGKTLTITLTMSEAVVVTGTPSLSLNDGGTATYTGGSGTSALTFTYTVAQGQNTSALKVTRVALPSGASILDLAGNKAVLSGAVGLLGVQIDTKSPTVTAEAAAAGSKDLNAGHTAEITLTMNEPVTVSGTPTLTLNDGGTAVYDAALSTATALTFDYTVQAGQNTTALKISGLGERGSIQDLAGRPAGGAACHQSKASGRHSGAHGVASDIVAVAWHGESR